VSTKVTLRDEVSTARVSGRVKAMTPGLDINPSAHADGTDFMKRVVTVDSASPRLQSTMLSQDLQRPIDRQSFDCVTAARRRRRAEE